MKILIASDHAGQKLKSYIIENFVSNADFIDLGPDSDESVDYPDFAKKLCLKLADDISIKFGILICGSGVGMSIAANRFSKIRASLCFTEEIAKLSRQHNDANVLCLGARMIEEGSVIKILDVFMKTKFASGRHQDRINKINDDIQS